LPWSADGIDTCPEISLLAQFIVKGDLLDRHDGRHLPARSLHHFVRHPAKKKGIGFFDVLHRVTMPVFVRDHFPMMAAPV
jgi:hypothetical protein